MKEQGPVIDLPPELRREKMRDIRDNISVIILIFAMGWFSHMYYESSQKSDVQKAIEHLTMEKLNAIRQRRDQQPEGLQRQVRPENETRKGQNTSSVCRRVGEHVGTKLPSRRSSSSSSFHLYSPYHISRSWYSLRRSSGY